MASPTRPSRSRASGSRSGSCRSGRPSPAEDQALVVLTGSGLIAWEALDAPRDLRPGDWVHVSPGVPHWHGAAPASVLVHLAVTAGGETLWLGPVDDEPHPPDRDG